MNYARDPATQAKNDVGAHVEAALVSVKKDSQWGEQEDQDQLNDVLRSGVDFYDPIVAELLATSILTLIWSSYIIHVISGVYERRLISRFRGELIGLLVLFVLWLVGAAIATSYWGNLHWCWIYRPCRILTALLAFAWIGWITIFFIFVYTLLFALSNNVVMEPLHARWNPRVSVFGGRRV